MRLIDLHATWINRGGRVVGVRFTCPVNDGSGPHADGHSVCVLFANPVDGGPAHPNDDSCPGNSKGRRWQRIGNTFETLSLHPSVDCTTSEGCDKPEHSKCSHAHCWHGFVTNGDAT